MQAIVGESELVGSYVSLILSFILVNSAFKVVTPIEDLRASLDETVLIYEELSIRLLTLAPPPIFKFKAEVMSPFPKKLINLTNTIEADI